MLNEDKVIRIFCLIDNLLQGIGYQEGIRRKVSDSEIITSAIGQHFILAGIRIMQEAYTDDKVLSRYVRQEPLQPQTTPVGTIIIQFVFFSLACI